MKQCFLFILFTLVSLKMTAQYSTSKHHYFNKTHKSRVSVHKKFNNIQDSAFVSFEFLVGNTNSWNGDVYNFYPALQLLGSYDNNKNFEVGGFACFTTSSLQNLDVNGVDIFASYRFNDKLSVTADVYTYMGNKTFLADDLGYESSIYQLYSSRFQYAISDKKSAILGYSILNDCQSLQQSVFAEYDYNPNDYFTFIIGYASETDILQFNSANINLGLGYRNTFFSKSKMPVKLNVGLFPIAAFQNTGKSPLTILFSVDF
jgi:hypothetical protein